MEKYQKKPRDGAAQEKVRRKHGGGGQEARNWRHYSPSGRAGTGPQVEAVRGGGWFKEMAEDGQYQEGIIHRSLQVRYRNLGRRKEGKRMEREAAEAARGTGLQGSKGA